MNRAALFIDAAVRWGSSDPSRGRQHAERSSTRRRCVRVLTPAARIRHFATLSLRHSATPPPQEVP